MGSLVAVELTAIEGIQPHLSSIKSFLVMEGFAVAYPVVVKLKGSGYARGQAAPDGAVLRLRIGGPWSRSADLPVTGVVGGQWLELCGPLADPWVHGCMGACVMQFTVDSALGVKTPAIAG